MNQQEYDQFSRRASDAYPGLRDHTSSANDPQTLHAMWAEALAGVPLARALEALASMVAGTTDRPDFGWGDFPKTIRQAAADLDLAEQARRPDESDRSGEVRCLLCQDSSVGFVFVWNPWFVQSVGAEIAEAQTEREARDVWRRWKRAKTQHRGGIYLPAICTCESKIAVRRRADTEKGEWSGTVGIYSAKRFAVWRNDNRDRMDLFREWWTPRQDVREHEGYNQEFAGWDQPAAQTGFD